MHWNADKYAGFSTVTPWLKPTDQAEINVEKELASGQIFTYYQQLIKLRKEMPLISAGHFQTVFKHHPQVFAYRRYLDNQAKELLVINNFYGQETELD